MYTRELLAAIHCTTRDRRPPPLVPALDHALTPAPTMPAPALQPRPCPRPHSSPAPAGTLILVPPLPLFSSQSRPQPAQAEALAQQQIPLTQSYRLRLPGPVMTSALPNPDTKHLSSPILPCPRSAPSLAQTYTFAGPTLHHPPVPLPQTLPQSRTNTHLPNQASPSRPRDHLHPAPAKAWN